MAVAFGPLARWTVRFNVVSLRRSTQWRRRRLDQGDGGLAGLDAADPP
jgi:hypothetical protein